MAFLNYKITKQINITCVDVEKLGSYANVIKQPKYFFKAIFTHLLNINRPFHVFLKF